MIEPPSDFLREEMEPVTAHPADATHLPFHHTPESFDAVRMHVTADIFAFVVIDAPVDISELRERRVHRKTVGIHA